MSTFEVYHELPNRRAMVMGDYSSLRIDDNIVIVDAAETEYDAVVETRVSGGAIVRVTGVRD